MIFYCFPFDTRKLRILLLCFINFHVKNSLIFQDKNSLSNTFIHDLKGFHSDSVVIEPASQLKLRCVFERYAKQLRAVARR